MSYPFEGNKIYKSSSLSKTAKKCHNEFKQLNGISDGMFCITNIDTNKEYRFKAINNNITRIKKKKQYGGDTDDQVEEILNVTGAKEETPTVQPGPIEEALGKVMTLVTETKGQVDALSQQIEKQPIPPASDTPETVCKGESECIII